MAPVNRKGGSPLPPIGGIVLAAGMSSRMGRSKAELMLDGRSFLERCIDLLRQAGCEPVVGVVASAEQAFPKPRKHVLWAQNPEPGSQQIESIRIGLATLPEECAAALVLPVDAPAVKPETVRALMDAFRAAEPGSVHVVRPVNAGSPGHPTLFARTVFEQLNEPGLTQGAETIVQRHSASRIDVPVDDPGIAGNVNTPEDYQRLVQGT